MPALIRFQLASLADHVAYFGQIVLLLRRGERNGGIEARDADNGAIEIVKGFFIDDGGDFSGEASCAGVLVEDDDFVCFLHGLRDGFAVERRDGTQVEDFDVDIFFCEDISGLEG